MAKLHVHKPLSPVNIAMRDRKAPDWVSLCVRMLLVLLTLVLSSVACSKSSNVASTPSPTPTPKRTSVALAEDESEFQQDVDDAVMRSEVRQSVSDTIKSKLPSWTIKGLAVEVYRNNVFWVTVDLHYGEKNVVISLVVRRFFPESGSAYWKTVFPSKLTAKQLHDMDDSHAWNELNTAKAEIESLRDSSDTGDIEGPDPY